MKKTGLNLLSLSLMLLLPFAASAQEVHNRQIIQQHRIGQGVKSGQITFSGLRHLEGREANINASRKADLAANGGHLTPAETSNLNRRENSLSHQIFVDKHNAVTQPGVVPR